MRPADFWPIAETMLCERCGQPVETRLGSSSRKRRQLGRVRSRTVPGMNAPTLFDLEPVGRVRHTDPDTSRKAARKVGSFRARIIEAREKHGPLTDGELCDRLVPEHPLSRQTVISARSAMKKDGTVDDTGDRREDRIVWDLAGPIRTVRTTGDWL